MREPMRLLAPVLLTLLLGISTGCVQRKMIIVSNPPGAEVYHDGTYAGTTPLTIPFAHFGTHDILVRHPGVELPSGDRRIYRSKLQKLWLQPPWWQITPVDFFVEHFWPVPLVYEKRLEVELDLLSERTPTRIDDVKSRAELFRQEAAELRASDPEGHTNPPPADPDAPLEFDGEADESPAPEPEPEPEPE